jgi:membrane associated rhomboid family serine protease
MRQGWGVVLAVAAGLAALHGVLVLLGEQGAEARRTALWVSGAMAFDTTVLRQGDFLFPGQRLAMGLTHALVHVGWLHLAVNLAMLVAVGPGLAGRLGAARFLGFALSGVLAAVAVYAAVMPEGMRLKGASGAIHAIAGGLAAALWAEGRRGAAVGVLAGVLALNAGFWIALDGRFAWTLHAGGVTAGPMLWTAWRRRGGAAG